MAAARTAAVVLAAGAATRFGTPKVLAALEGRPLLEHVLAVARDAGLAERVVVLGHAADAVEGGIVWSGERRVRNPHPERGLASSLQVGLAALGEGIDAALILLGDQPALRQAVVDALLAHGVTAERPVAVPRYAGEGGRNPVLVARSAWPLAAQASGDRGLGPWLAAHPELVAEVPVGGTNPDVDTPGDLAALAWARRVAANREQVERLREAPDGPDFYASVRAVFRADPLRRDDPTLDALLALARPGETWLDVGAGAGRYALPLARRVAAVTAVEPSPGMREALAEAAAASGIANIRLVDARWPMADPPLADVALIANVGYDIEAIGPFLDALEAAARRACVALLMEQAPAMAAAAYWPQVHGEPRVPLPALADFVALLRARGARPSVRRLVTRPTSYASFDDLLAFLRRQTWVLEGGAKDRRLVELARERAIHDGDGWRLRPRPQAIGLVVWNAD